MSNEPLAKCTVQFPLCCLARGSDEKARVIACLAWAVMSAGLKQSTTLTQEEVEEKISHLKFSRPKPPLPADDFKAVCLGDIYTGIHFESARFVWSEYRAVQNFLAEWKSKGRKAPLTRVPSDIALATCKGQGDYKFFAALAAFNAAIGSKPYFVVTRNRIRAGMLGYEGGGMLFDRDGNLTESGIALIAEREDGLIRPPSESQARTLLEKIVLRGLGKRYTPPGRGTLSYYSKFKSPEEMAGMLIKRELRTAKGLELEKLDAQLVALKSGKKQLPLRGDSLLRGESSPLNDTPPLNEEVATQSPPDNHPVATQSPLNASYNASLNASDNASQNASESAISETVKAINPKPEYKPPTQEEATDFAKGLFKAPEMRDIATEWFAIHGGDAEWTTTDWKKSFSGFASTTLSQIKRAKALATT